MLDEVRSVGNVVLEQPQDEQPSRGVIGREAVCHRPCILESLADTLEDLLTIDAPNTLQPLDQTPVFHEFRRDARVEQRLQRDPRFASHLGNPVVEPEEYVRHAARMTQASDAFDGRLTCDSTPAE